MKTNSDRKRFYQNKREIRRNEIVQGLHRCIIKHGYVHTKIRDIATEAGLPFSLIHHYFDTKEDIVVMLVKQLYETFKQAFELSMKDYQDLKPDEQLRVGVEFLFTNLYLDRDLYTIIYEVMVIGHRVHEVNDILKQVFSWYRKEVAQFIRGLAEKVSVTIADIENLAFYIVSACEGAGLQWFIDQESVEMDNVKQLCYDHLHTLLKMGDRQKNESR